MNQLNGEWHAVATTLSGADQPPQTLVLKIEGSGYEISQNNQGVDRGSVSLLLGGKMEIRSQTDENKRLKAIYKLATDGLTICYDVSGKDWPTSFESRAGTTHYLVHYKKQIQPERMKKLVLVYGLIAGGIVAAMMFITIPMWKNGILNHTNGMVIGYTTMIIAFAPTIFIAVKTYRDNYHNGLITFWQGARIGLLITLLASVIYAASWEITYRNFMPNFMENYAAAQVQKMQDQRATEDEIAKAKEEWASVIELYQNPVIRFGMTMTEILPVGIVITLLSAGLLRKRELLPAAA